MFRLANMLHLSQMDYETSWKIIQKVRKEFVIENPYSDMTCLENVMLSDQNIAVIIKSVENMFNLNQAVPEDTIADIKQKTLQIAAEMFIFLNYCPPKGSVCIVYTFSNQDYFHSNIHLVINEADIP